MAVTYAMSFSGPGRALPYSSLLHLGCCPSPVQHARSCISLCIQSERR